MKATVTFALLQLSFFSFSQKLNYDIFLFGNVIGQSVVEKKQVNDSVANYTLQSNSEAHIFFSLHKNTLEYDVLYTCNKLTSSYAKNIRNDEIYTTYVSREVNFYSVKRNNEAFIISPKIDCSSVKLFFAEPCNTNEIFSERLGEFRQLKKLAPAEYEVDMKDGVTYIYRYSNGKLVELEMKKGLLGSIFLRLHIG